MPRGIYKRIKPSHNIGRKQSQDEKDKRRESALRGGSGKWMLGRKLPAETCKKISKSNQRGIYKDCVICNKKYYVQRKLIEKSKCCSINCLYKYLSVSKKGKPGKNKGKHWKIKNTSNMNKDKIGKTGNMLGKLGNKNPNYINDRSLLKTDRQKAYDTKYKYWMLEVKNRDKWKCKINNSDCRGRLESHHILSWKEYPELRYVINNGITLCHAHHPRKRAEEKRLIPMFKELMSVSKV